MLYFTKDIFDISIYNKYMYIELKEGMQITSDIVIDKYDYIVISGLCEGVVTWKSQRAVGWSVPQIYIMTIKHRD